MPADLHVIQLAQWSCGFAGGDAYDPPEVRGLRLSGTVKGHPRKPDGTQVVTSAVRSVEGRIVQTASGSVYELVGEPEHDYLDYLAKLGRSYDPEAPISVVGRARHDDDAGLFEEELGGEA